MLVEIAEIRDSMNEGTLKVMETEDGDVIVSITTVEDHRRLGKIETTKEVQFCTLRGGGTTPKTLQALLALHKAIVEDNQTKLGK